MLSPLETLMKLEFWVKFLTKISHGIFFMGIFFCFILILLQHSMVLYLFFCFFFMYITCQHNTMKRVILIEKHTSITHVFGTEELLFRT